MTSEEALNAARVTAQMLGKHCIYDDLTQPVRHVMDGDFNYSMQMNPKNPDHVFVPGLLRVRTSEDNTPGKAWGFVVRYTLE